MNFLDDLLKRKENSAVKPVEKHVVMSPVKGRTILLRGVPDPASAEGILSVGVAVISTEGCVYVPVDGTVATAFPTEHATGLIGDDGMEVLIHVGINTVTMKGDDFGLRVGQGDRVTRGQLFLTFELEKIRTAGHEMMTMALVSNVVNLGTLEVLCEGDVNVGQKLYCLE